MASTEIPQIDVAELEERLAAGVALVDVREPDEYVEAHVPGAQLIPLGEVPDRLGELPDGPIVVICKVGGRSQRACELLAAQGRDVTNVTGGTTAWMASGRGVVTGAERG